MSCKLYTYKTLHYITLHCLTFTLHFIIFHYITLHNITSHTYLDLPIAPCSAHIIFWLFVCSNPDGRVFAFSAGDLRSLSRKIRSKCWFQKAQSGTMPRVFLITLMWRKTLKQWAFTVFQGYRYVSSVLNRTPLLMIVCSLREYGTCACKCACAYIYIHSSIY